MDVKIYASVEMYDGLRSFKLLIVNFNDAGRTILLRKLISGRKYMMCCEGNVVGLKLPEDGVNKHRNV
jgi:hypothetical protein